MVGSRGLNNTNRELVDDEDKKLLDKWRPLIEYLEEKKRDSNIILEVLTQVNMLINKDKVSENIHIYDKEVDTIELKTLSRS